MSRKLLPWLGIVSLCSSIASAITLLIILIIASQNNWTVMVRPNDFGEGWIELLLLAILTPISWLALIIWGRRLLSHG